MKCQKCKTDEAQYQVYTEKINLEVCTSCAIEALSILIVSELSPRLRSITSRSLFRLNKTADILDGDRNLSMK